MDEINVSPGEGIGTPFGYVICPYNEAHHIERYKLDFHLIKCGKQHGDKKIKVCPFNATHIVLEATFDHHVKTCRESKMLDQMKYNLDPSSDRLPAPTPVPEVQPSEDWEDDNVTPYNPQEQACRQPNIIRKIKGATPADRRAFRMAQRHEFTKNN